MGLVLGPHAHTNRTRDLRVTEPRPRASKGGWLGEGQFLTPDAPYNGGRPAPPRGRPPPTPALCSHSQGMQTKGTVLGPHSRTPTPTARGWRTPTARPEGVQPGEEERLNSDAPHNGGGYPPPGTPFRHPHSAQRRLARAHPVGPVLCLHAHTNRSRDTRAAAPRQSAPKDGRLREGQRLTPDTPRNSGRPTPPGMDPHHPRSTQLPAEHAWQGDSAGSPHLHTRTHSTWAADPDSPPRGRTAGGGGSPEPRRPSQRRKATPPGTPLRYPHSTQ